MTDQSTAKRKWFHPFILLRLAGLILFIFILFQIDIDQAWNILQSSDYKWILVAVLLQVFMLLIKGYRWFIMSSKDQQKQGLSYSLGVFFESYALGVVTPGRLGEWSKAGREKGKGNKLAAIFKVFAERGFDLGIFLFFAAFGFTQILSPSQGTFVSIIVSLAGGLIIFIAYLILSNSRFNRFIYSQLSKVFKSIDSDYSFTSKDTKAATTTLLLSLLSNISYFLSAFVLTKAVGLKLSFMLTSGGVAVAGLINMLPVTIMGLGTREYTLLSLFPGEPEAYLMAFSLLLFLVAQIGGGLLGFTGSLVFLRIHKKTKT